MRFQHERGTAAKRHLDWTKAIRKKKISDRYSLFGIPYYDNLHQYSKNKIHCSCPLCRAKTYDYPSVSDIRKTISMNEQLKEAIA